MLKTNVNVNANVNVKIDKPHAASQLNANVSVCVSWSEGIERGELTKNRWPWPKTQKLRPKKKKKYKKSKAKQSKAEQSRAERATRNSSPNDGYGSDNESSAEMCEVAVKPEES